MYYRKTTQFDFDLDTGKAALAGKIPNEVTIFFPFAQYGSTIPNMTRSLECLLLIVGCILGEKVGTVVGDFDLIEQMS